MGKGCLRDLGSGASLHDLGMDQHPHENPFYSRSDFPWRTLGDDPDAGRPAEYHAGKSSRGRPGNSWPKSRTALRGCVFRNAAQKLGALTLDSKVRALVSLTEDAEGAYRLAVVLHAELPGIAPAVAQSVMELAHQTCPYSKALRGDASVTLMVD